MIEDQNSMSCVEEIKSPKGERKWSWFMRKMCPATNVIVIMRRVSYIKEFDF